MSINSQLAAVPFLYKIQFLNAISNSLALECDFIK